MSLTCTPIAVVNELCECKASFAQGTGMAMVIDVHDDSNVHTLNVALPGQSQTCLSQLGLGVVTLLQQV